MPSIFPVAAHAARFGSCGVVVAVVLMAATMAVAPGVAAAQQCPEASPTYTDACGPTFALPPWGDGGGWTDPSKYSTIQLADVNGDGSEELIARNDQGLEIYWFDTSVGQWRPQVDGNGVQQVLTDFRSPLPAENPATDWTKPQYYSTIQAADIDGLTGFPPVPSDPGEEILARAADGMRVYRYTPPPGSKNIDGGSWTRIGTGGPFSDAAGYGDATLYPTIQVVKLVLNFPPLLVARRHSSDFNSSLAFYGWSNGTWLTSETESETFPDAFTDAACGQPSCYLNIKTGNIAQGDPNGLQLQSTDLMGRIQQGVTAYNVSPDILNYWHLIPGTAVNHPTQSSGPFSDVAGGPDCPFTTSTADCLGSSPAYYETLAAANLDGQPGDELFARASDGLRVKRWNGTGFQALATLTDLAGAASGVSAGMWGSIRTGDINKDGRDEVLALTGGGLQSWSYDPGSKSWSQLKPSTPLTLTGEWLTKPEYYSTIQTGDVDGDGRADVLARGPYGIRTWFYDRRKTGGWERYMADGYPDFPGTATTGQQGAFAVLNALALSKGAITAGSKIRDAWSMEKVPPDLATTLATLQVNLAGSLVGNCSDQTKLAPPTYASCALPAPADMSGYSFNAADWTAVVNELIAEAYFAEQVVGHFGDLDSIRASVFESASGAMPAIGADLQLDAASGTPTDFNMQNFFAGLTGITASIAGLAEAGGPEISAGLWVVSEIFSMLPSASATANSSFQTTYDGLLTKLATARDEMAQALISQSEQVRSDQGLLGVVGQLRSRGTWALNSDGMESTSRQAFVIETYKALVPTVYDRYWVNSCTYVDNYRSCDGPSPGPGVMGNSQAFRTIGLPPATSLGLPLTPCIYHENTGSYYCHYDTNSPPAALMSRIWGAVSPTCNYQPGNPNTAWTYGCNLGVPVATSIGNSPWPFTTHAGSPVTLGLGSAAAVSATPGVVRASVARAARAAQVGSSARASRNVLGPLRFSGRVFFSRGLRLRRTRVVVARTLFEHGRREELARSGAGRRLRPFALRQVRDGLFTSARRGAPRARLRVRRLDVRGGARLDLRLTRVRTRDIRALCTVLPARVHRAGRPLELETRLRLRDGAATHAIRMSQRWRCVRDRKGEFSGIRPIKPKRAVARPGLAVRMKAPRVSASGRRATVRITVANQRRPRPSRAVSSLWDLRITATAGGPPRTVRVKELRARRSRTLRLTMPVPRRARGRVCVQVAAIAPAARAAGARRCTRIAGAPRSAGCATDGNAACAPAAGRQRATRPPATPSPTSSTIAADGTGTR